LCRAVDGLLEAASPPKREWVGLTDKDISVVVDAYTFDSAGYEIWTDGEALARDVQAKLKEKNQ
jgi:hypothetical protein